MEQGSSLGAGKTTTSARTFRAKFLEKEAENKSEVPPEQEDEIANFLMNTML